MLRCKYQNTELIIGGQMEEKSIINEFSELLEIKDETLKRKTISALKSAIETGGWNEKTIHLVPVTLNWDVQCTLLEHIHAVTRMCMLGYDVVQAFYINNGMQFRRDYVIAGALLHDIGKFIEFSFKDGEAVHGVDAFMRHPFLGAEIAERVGIPKELVYLIAMHSFEGDHSQHTPESDYVRRIDMDVFKSTVFGLKRK